MNREIKYRGKVRKTRPEIAIGKRPKDGTWVVGDLVCLYAGHPHIHFGLQAKISIDPDTIGQFTGLHDKNGKEIYEGDIVRYWCEDTRCINPDCDAFNWIYESFIKKVEGVVSCEDGMFVCEDYTPLYWCGIQNLEELRNDLNVTEEDEWMDCDGNVIDESVLGIEVIGNIHDNKDL